MSANDIIDKFYAPPKKVEQSSLGGLINEQLGTALERLIGQLKMLSEAEDSLGGDSEGGDVGERVYNLVLAQFKAPSEKTGDPSTEEREFFKKYIQRNISGTNLKTKIENINKIAEAKRPPKGVSIAQILSSLGALKMLQHTLDDFSEATAGFLFESFLAALLGGKQVIEKVKGSLQIEDAIFYADTMEKGQAVSLKLLGPNTTIDGSIRNLLSFFENNPEKAIEQGLEYVVATKRKEAELDIYSFTIYPENFFEWIHSKSFNFSEGETLKEEERPSKTRQWRKKGGKRDPWSKCLEKAEDGSVKIAGPERCEIVKRKDILEKAFRSFFAPAIGFGEGDLEFNYNWGSVTTPNKAKWIPSFTRKDAGSLRANLKNGEAEFQKWMTSGWAPSGWNYEKPIFYSQWRPDGWDEEKYQIPGPEYYENLTDAQVVGIAKNRRSMALAAIAPAGLSAKLALDHAKAYWQLIQHVKKLNAEGGEAGPGKVSGSEALYKQKSKSKNPEEIKEWAAALKELVKISQFDIHPDIVRSKSFRYGTIKISKQSIQNQLQFYADQLGTQIVPIYESLSNLTGHINSFFLENKTGGAISASTEAGKLQAAASQLTSEG